METRANPTQAWRFGVFEVDARNMELRRSGTAVKIREQSFSILVFLLEHAGELVTREELCRVLWPSDTFVDFDHSLNAAVMKLREALGDSADKPLYVETIPKRGYRFIAPLSQTAGVRNGPASSKGDANSNPILSPIVLSSIEANDQSGPDSIAVLPFGTGAGEPDGAYLSEGFTASIINNLSQLRDLRVVPTTTAFKYVDRRSTASQSARELAVRVVLTGEIAKHGNALTISAELLDAIHESQLWGTRYNCQLEDIVAIQADIASQVATRLRLRVGDTERRQLARLPTESREAYHLYLRAMHWGKKLTAEGLRKGIDYTRQAIDADPAYAGAWKGLSYLYLLAGLLGAAPTDTFPRAKAAAFKALEIDDREADARAILAFVRLIYEWDWQGCLQGLLRVIEIAPNLASGHDVYSYWYVTQGLYKEAAIEAKRALDIDPLSVRYSYLAGFISFSAGQYDLAIEQLCRTLELDPSFAPPYQFLAYAYVRKKMRNESIAALEKAPEGATNDSRREILRAIVDAQTGEPAKARIVLDKLRQELTPPDFASAYHCAVLHALLGETDQSFESLEMAREGRSIYLMYLAIAPNLESLHDDPRFLDLLRSIGIPISGTLESSYRKRRAAP